ncbi:MAG TPA: hypothetical protein EYP30_09950 [Archaeoglobaceae archaeon]|nr:hypothetical protein [Archaeoglobaceae archaeon]
MELSLTDIKLSNPIPVEGEEIKIYAKITNFGNSKVKDVWAVFYYTPELLFKKDRIEKYRNPEYEIHREKIGELDSGKSQVITFGWVAKKDFKSIFVYAEE